MKFQFNFNLLTKLTQSANTDAAVAGLIKAQILEKKTYIHLNKQCDEEKMH